MRNLSKTPAPEVLATNCSAWLADYLADLGSSPKRTRYRHPEIKAALREETASKCVYCESKIGHNTPGDVEHKVPSSKDHSLHFEWLNLTLACTECNRRKNDYFEKGSEFLDPYSDDVEECLVHLGPLVFWKPGHSRAEITVRILELHSGTREQLLDRKRDTLEKARSLLDLAAKAPSELLGALRVDEVERMADRQSEYSAMVKTYINAVRPQSRERNRTERA